MKKKNKKEKFVSQAQRGFMYANHPRLAAEFESKTPKGAKLPRHVRSKTKAKNYALNDRVSSGIRRGVTGVANTIGQSIYRALPGQKRTLDAVADWGSKKLYKKALKDASSAMPHLKMTRKGRAYKAKRDQKR